MIIAASLTPNQTKFGPLLFPGDVSRGIRELSEAGYEGIELSLRTPGDIDYPALMRDLEKHGMVLASVATGQSFIEDGISLFHEDPEKRARTVERLKGYVDMVAPAGGGVILGGIKGMLTAADKDAQFAAGSRSLDECLEYAERRGAYLLLEAINRYETNFFNTVGDCGEYIDSKSSGSLFILPDVFHMNIEEKSIKAALDSAARHIGAIHCADSNRLAPGMGHVDFADVLGNIDAYSNLRYLGVEVLPLPDSSTCASTAMSTIKAALSSN